MATEEGLADAAIRALGHLFRLTEVFLWDDASEPSSRRDVSREEKSPGYASSAVSSSHIGSIMEDSTSVEDLELAKQMDAMGLPTSFKTNKERKNSTTGGKRREVPTKFNFGHIVRGSRIPDVSGLDEVVGRTSSQASDSNITLLNGCLAKQAKNDTSYFVAENEVDKFGLYLDNEPNDQGDVILQEINMEQLCTTILDVPNDSTICMCSSPRVNVEQNADSCTNLLAYCSTNTQDNAVNDNIFMCHQYKFCEQRCHRNADASNLSCVSEGKEASISSGSTNWLPDGHRFGNNREWGVFWDSCYMRNYYYNFHTHESTWFPPPCLELSGLSFTSYNANGDVMGEVRCPSFSWNGNYHDDAPNVSTAASKVVQCGEVPDDEVEDNSYLACDDNNNQHFSETKTFRHMQNDVLSGHASHEVMSRGSYADENFVSDMEPSLSSSRCMDFDNHVRQTNHLETGTSVEDFYAPLHTQHKDRSTNVSNDADADGNWLCSSEQLDVISVNLFSHPCLTNHNKKKKVRRIKCNQMTPSGASEDHTLSAFMEGLPAYLFKYWCQRYLLFSKYDHGMKVDEEGWFSITPEALARHHASRCDYGTVIDCFTGVGGNAIQFAMKSNHVIAVDVDPQKVDYAQHNAAIYGVGSNIDFVKGDFFDVASQLKADTVFMSPPWGGPDYARVEVYDIRSMLKPCDGFSLFRTAMRIAPTVIMFLPRNVDPNQLAELSLLACPPWELEVERNYLNGKLKGVTAYFRQPSSENQATTP